MLHRGIMLLWREIFCIFCTSHLETELVKCKSQLCVCSTCNSIWLLLLVLRSLTVKNIAIEKLALM